MKNKVFTMLTTICLVLLMVPQMISANEQGISKDIDMQMVEMGVPTELLELWSPELKSEIIENSKEFVSFEHVRGREVLNEFTNNNQIGIMSNIPESTFDFYITVFNDGYNSNSRKQLSVVLTCKWFADQPVWRLTDPYGATFDDDVFRLVDGGGFYEDRYTWVSSPNTWRTHATGTTYTYTAANGVGFNANLKGDNIGLPLVVDQQISSGLFKIEGKQSGAISGSSQIQANYYHVKGVGSFGLSFFGASVDFSGWATHDSRGTTKSFNY